MGNCKSSNADENPEEIKYEMKTVGIASYDEFYESASKVLECAENFRAGLGDSTNNMHEQAYNICLKEEGKLIDDVQAWIWALSANAEGKLKDVPINVGEEAPYVDIQMNNIRIECGYFKDELRTYLKTVIEGGPALVQLVQDIQSMLEKANGLMKTARTDAQAAGLPFSKIPSAVAAVGGNTNLLVKGLPKMQNVQKIIQQAAADLKELLPKVKLMLKEADIKGAQAAKQGWYTPKECMVHLHDGPKKTPEEIEAVIKAREQAKAEAAKKDKCKTKGCTPEKPCEKCQKKAAKKAKKGGEHKAGESQAVHAK